MTAEKNTHVDYVDDIGGTAATATGYLQRRWNRYYFRSCKAVVASMLRGEITAPSTVLDVGTSHGNWHEFLRRQGFSTVLGVELDPGRAELARRTGYDDVYACDARDTPLADDSLDVAVSNDVFVHILLSEDKAAVLAKVARMLRPGGVFVLNHSMALAFGRRESYTERHCSFLRLHDLLNLVSQVGGFAVEDVKPSYYSCAWDHSRGARFWFRSMTIAAPLGPLARLAIDALRARRWPTELSDYVYLKLRKTA